MPPTFNLQDEINKVTTQGSYGDLPYRAGGQSTIMGPQEPIVRPTTPTAPRSTAPATAPAPTVGETLAGIKQKALTIQEQLNAMANKGKVNTPTYDTGKTYEELYPEIDEREIERRQRRLFQSEIDATNRVYDDMLNQERLAGQGRLGTGRAIAARGGLLGSDFGEAQRQGIVSQNLGVERAVQNERSAKIGTILGTMRKAVADEITEKRAARQQGAENYINWLASSQTRKQNNANKAAQAILDAGLDPREMDEAELTAIGQDAGLSIADIISSYNQLKSANAAAELETRKTEAEIAKNQRFSLSEGQGMYDADGNLIASRAKTYKPETGSSAIPETISSTIRQTLESNRGSDNYTDTGKYLAEYQDFVNAGGTPEQFLKNFDPDIYINPSDPSRGWLESQMKKESSDPFAAFFGGGSSSVVPAADPVEEEIKGWWSSLTGN